MADIKINADFIYPIGSIYMSINSTDPGDIFGGTWERIAKGRTLVGVDENDTDFNQPSKTGGSKTVQHNHFKTESNGGRIANSAPSAGDYVIGTQNYVSNETIKIIQPYYTCYMWVRTA